MERQGYPFAPTRATNLLGTFSAGNIPLAGGLRGTYRYIYRTQPWVYIAINKIAKSFANLPLHTFTQDADTGEHIRVRPGDGVQGKLAQLFKRPTPVESEWDLKFAIATELFIHGHYLGVKTRAGGQVTDGANGALPAELWSVPWQNVEIVEGNRRPIDGFNVWLSGVRYPFAPEEVVHIQMQYGISPLEPLRQTLAIEDAALRETRAAFENGNRTQGLLIAPEKARMTPEERELIRSEFDARNGGVDNAYRTAIIGGGLTWEATQFDHTETQLVPVRQLAREEVVAAIDIPPPMVGILDHATYSNWEQAHRGFYMDSVGPICVKVEESLEVQLVAPEPEWAGLDLEFNMDEALKADLASRSEAYTKLIRVGFSVDEIRGFENRPQFGTPLSTTGWVAQELAPVDPEALSSWTDAQTNPTDNLANALSAIASRPEPAPANVTVNTPDITFPEQNGPEQMHLHLDSVPFTEQLNTVSTELAAVAAAMQDSNADVVKLIREQKPPEVNVDVQVPPPADPPKRKLKVIRDKKTQRVTGLEDV